MAKKTVKPNRPEKRSTEFVPIALTPENNEDVETFHAFSIGEIDYHGVCSIPFERARDLYRMLQTATRENPIDLDELVCIEVYGEEGWASLNEFKGLKKEDFFALVEKASDIALGTLGKGK
jgi:hypothetical protein